jgi:hypothetical protein
VLGVRVKEGLDGRTRQGHEEDFGVTGIVAILIVMMVFTYVKACQIVHLKYLKSIICQLYLSKSYLKIILMRQMQRLRGRN